MLTLSSECHFWTIREEVRIKANDFGAFRYARKGELQQHQHQNQQEPFATAKRDYTERRNGIAVLKNKRRTGGHLKDNIKKLEEMLRMHNVVTTQWQDATQVLLLFANGIIAHICVDVYTGDILRMVFEKYLVGKLAAEAITDAFFTRSHIVLAYNTNQVTVVHLQQPNTRLQGPQKIANMDARIFHVLIPAAGERKLARHLCVNSSYDLFVIWTKSSQNEVYPWRPTLRDQDRANIHVFKLKGMQVEPMSYCWSEHDPLCVDFLRSSESQVLVLEQKVSRKGDISAEICTYELTTGKMQRTHLTSILMGTQISCYAFSPDQEKLFLGTIDRNICLHDLVVQSNKFLGPIDIIPTQCSWHCDSSIIIIANERSQFQCFDLALTPIANQLQSEDVTPSNLLDLSHYFTVQQTLLNIAFSLKPDLAHLPQSYAQTDCFLLLVYENGPIACLRFFAGTGMRGDIHNSGLTVDVIVDRYLSLNQLEKAVSLLSALNWETYGAMCLISLHKIANHVFFRGEVKHTRLELMAKALKTFTDTLSEETKDEFSDQVFDMKRRFFFFLLRKNLYNEAFEIAQDIEDYDLFMDLFNVTKSDGNLIEFSAAAFSQAAAILHEEERANGNSSLAGDCRSESACSQSTCSDAHTTQPSRSSALKTYVPPLPSFKSKVFNAEMIKINIPKPELRVDVNAAAQERARLSIPPLPDVRYLKQTSANAITNSSTTNSNGTASTLAALSMQRSGNFNTTDPQQLAHINGDAPSNSWPDTTEALFVQPSFVQSPIGGTQNMLPRTSAFTPTSSNVNLSMLSGQKQPQVAAPYLHYATPALVSEHNPSTTQRMYQSSQTQFPVAPIPMYQPKFYQHPLVSGTIPPTSISADHVDHQKRLLLKKPTASILSNSVVAHNGNLTLPLAGTGGGTVGGSSSHKESAGGARNVAGERNKVKFSDTVQVAVVPEIPRKEKPMTCKRNGYSRPTPRNLTNPKKELADSLPLCHPHDDYLKDFNPISTDEAPRPPPKSSTSSSSNKSTPPAPPPSIKVVHFGVV